MKQTYECGFRWKLEEGSTVPVAVKASMPEKAAEKFAHYAHYHLGAWEDGDNWEGEKSIGVRPVGCETFTYFNIERRVVPEFTVTEDIAAAETRAAEVRE